MKCITYTRKMQKPDLFKMYLSVLLNILYLAIAEQYVKCEPVIHFMNQNNKSTFPTFLFCSSLDISYVPLDYSKRLDLQNGHKDANGNCI